MSNNNNLPEAFIKSKANFNPYQYDPFYKVFKPKDSGEGYELTGKNLLIADEVGVGKTIEAGIIMTEYAKNFIDNSILIICPVKLCQNWQSELEKFFELEFSIFDGEISGGYDIIPSSYFSSNKIQDPNLSSETENQEKIQAIKDLNYNLIIIDEAHIIRNDNILRSSIKSLLQHEENDKLRIFMTATPVFNKEEDLNNITELLGTHEKTTTLQAVANCRDEFLQIDIIEVKLEDSEQKFFDGIISDLDNTCKGFIRRLGASSLMAVKKWFESRLEKVKSDEEIEKEYKENLVRNLTTFVRRFDEFYKQNNYIDTKLKNLKDKIKEIFKEGDQYPNQSKGIIIFSYFKDTGNYLLEKLQEEFGNVYFLNGDSTSDDVNRVKMEFKEKVEDGEEAILICSSALAEGHNFQFCQNLIHYDLPFTPAQIGQRNGRIYRTGQKGKPRAYYMLVDNSYDDRLFGEIILEKCTIVKSLSDVDRISWLNILPKDAGDKIEKTFTNYLTEKVNDIKIKRKTLNQSNEGSDLSNLINFNEAEREQEIIEETNEEKQLTAEEVIFKRYLKKYFYKNGEWRNPSTDYNVKELFDNANTFIDKDNYYINTLVVLIREDMKYFNKDSTSLEDMHLDDYKAKEENLFKEWYGDDWESELQKFKNNTNNSN